MSYFYFLKLILDASDDVFDSGSLEPFVMLSDELLDETVLDN
jgi:hypothetical protein